MDYAGTARRSLISKEERLKTAKMKSIAQQRKRECEDARLKRGKKEKNYILFVNKAGGFTTRMMIAEMLEVLSIDFSKVISLQNDPEKNSTVEVLLKEEVDVDLVSYNRILTENTFDRFMVS